MDRIAVNLLTETVPVSSRVAVDVFLSSRDSEVGVEFYKADSQLQHRKTLFLSDKGFKEFLRFRKRITGYFMKFYEKEDQPDFETIIEIRKTGIVKLILYKYKDYPYCSLTFFTKVN